MKSAFLCYDWKFCCSDDSNAYSINFDDSGWRTVRVPHDYAIEGPFDRDNDLQHESVSADGIVAPITHVGRTGGLPIAKGAWYRRKFTVSPEAKHVFLEFDGVMSNSEIYVNGTHCGGRPYGYSSFSVDITALCHGGENLLAVRTLPEESSSRWYPGAGIYRNVRLIEKSDAYFPYNPLFAVSTPVGDGAKVDCTLKVMANNAPYTVKYTICDKDGNTVATAETKGTEAVVKSALTIKNYRRWHINAPYLYAITAELYQNSILKDTYKTSIGVRTIKFDANNGFFLNGENIKLNGVCLHHDAGALGAAVNIYAYRRQLEKLIDIGVNAIRCTHNPPSPEMLDLCDEYGIVAIDEAFDMWKRNKTKNDYAKHFEKWAEVDLVDMIHRDRNHPSVIMYSLGNEILEQKFEDGWQVAKFLNEICHREDNTRPTTCGFNTPIDAFKNGLCDHVDVIGINYKPHLYEQFHKEYPNAILYGSETSSCVSSRGEYFLDCEVSYPPKMRDNLQVNSYDTEAPPWAYTPDKEFAAQERYDFVFGEFVWTGFDYLGEPTPYREEWPSRSSYFGIFDLAGMEKDRYYAYKAQWTSEDVLHIFPHWNWCEGDVVDVHCYTGFDEVELFLNGRSLGRRTKDSACDDLSHRIIWKGVPFESGELKAVATQKPHVIDIVRTAGDPQSIKLEPEKSTLIADGNDILYVKCTAVDDEGNLCPRSDMKIDFKVEGVGEYLASDNGDATDTRTFSESYCNMYNGRCMAIIRTLKDSPGEIKLTAKGGGLAATCEIQSR